MSKKTPPVPRFESGDTTETAIAQTIKELLSDRVQAIKLLSMVEKSEIPRFSLMLSISKDFELQWLEDYVMNDLALSSAIKGRRADQIVTITKSPAIMSESVPFLDKMKRRMGL
jgi:hypothetical protein